MSRFLVVISLKLIYTQPTPKYREPHSDVLLSFKVTKYKNGTIMSQTRLLLLKPL